MSRIRYSLFQNVNSIFSTMNKIKKDKYYNDNNQTTNLCKCHNRNTSKVRNSICMDKKVVYKAGHYVNNKHWFYFTSLFN